MKELFETDIYTEELPKPSGNTCLNCCHRERFALNQYSSKVIQCCILQPSKKSNSGYKTIKVTNPACVLWGR